MEKLNGGKKVIQTLGLIITISLVSTNAFCSPG